MFKINTVGPLLARSSCSSATDWQSRRSRRALVGSSGHRKVGSVDDNGSCTGLGERRLQSRSCPLNAAMSIDLEDRNVRARAPGDPRLGAHDRDDRERTATSAVRREQPMEDHVRHARRRAPTTNGTRFRGSRVAFSRAATRGETPSVSKDRRERLAIAHQDRGERVAATRRSWSTSNPPRLVQSRAEHSAPPRPPKRSSRYGFPARRTRRWSFRHAGASAPAARSSERRVSPASCTLRRSAAWSPSAGRP